MFFVVSVHTTSGLVGKREFDLRLKDILVIHTKIRHVGIVGGKVGKNMKSMQVLED